MNIVVRTVSGAIFVRPDTTWERDNEDLFLAPFIDCLTFTPVLFARISKPGRSVGLEFADRYYDGVGYGLLLYAEDLIGTNPYGIACASCVDHTSFLPFPVHDKSSLARENSEFILSKGGEELFRYKSGSAAMINEAISAASEKVYIRSGDILALELDGRKPLFFRTEKSVEIKGQYCDLPVIEFKIIP